MIRPVILNGLWVMQRTKETSLAMFFTNDTPMFDQIYAGSSAEGLIQGLIKTEGYIEKGRVVHNNGRLIIVELYSPRDELSLFYVISQALGFAS